MEIINVLGNVLRWPGQLREFYWSYAAMPSCDSPFPYEPIPIEKLIMTPNPVSLG